MGKGCRRLGKINLRPTGNLWHRWEAVDLACNDRLGPTSAVLQRMFVLAVFHDTIPIEPVNFNKQHEEHLKELIQDLYVDRVRHYVDTLLNTTIAVFSL